MAELATERLRLRPFTAADEDLLVELDSDPAVMRYLTGGRPTPREEIRERTLPRLIAHHDGLRGPGYWAACERAGGEFIGWFHLRPPGDGAPGELELGYRLRRAAWGRGYATEGSRLLVRRAFDVLGAARVIAVTLAVNTGSRHVMEKVGLRLVRSFHQEWPYPVEGAEHGEVEYALTRAQWEELSAAGRGR